VQNVFGPIVGTSLASYALVRIAAAYDWNAAFFIAGIPGLILAVLIWRFIDEPERPAGAAHARPPGGFLPIGLLSHRNILLCSLVSACAVGSIVVGSIFMPLYLDGPRGYDDLTWSNIMAVVGICPAVGAIVVALLSDRIGRKTPLVVFASLMALAPAALLWFEGPVWMLTALMFVSWMGLVVMIGELTGGVFGPPIARRLADQYGLDVPLYIQGALAIGAGLAALFVRETNPQVLARRQLAGAVA